MAIYCNQNDLDFLIRSLSVDALGDALHYAVKDNNLKAIGLYIITTTRGRDVFIISAACCHGLTLA
jgi:hypothetical protein